MTRLISPAELEQEKLRVTLIRTVPELRSAMILQYGLSVGELAGMIARRLGRSADDLRIRTLAGAMIGVAMSVTLEAWDADGPALELRELHQRLDDAMNCWNRGCRCEPGC